MSGLVAATIIAGVLLIGMGVMRLGALIRFVPHTIITGFTAGMVVTIVLFMKMVSQETEVRGWRYYCDEDSEVTHLRELPRAVRVYEINGPMFFGMTGQLNDISVKDFTRVLIIRMRGVQLVIPHPNDQPMRTMERAGFVDQVGHENFLPNIDAAIARAAVLVDEK